MEQPEHDQSTDALDHSAGDYTPKTRGVHTPGPKATLGTIAGALTVVLVWIAELAGLDVPAEVASAVTVLIIGAVVYFAPDNGNM